MTPGQMFLWAVALVALGFCVRRGPGTLRRVGTETGQSLVKILPLFAVALPMAAFLAELMPADAAVAWIGPDSGPLGVVIASVAGGFMPGGPFVTFPLVLAFAKAGAGVPQMTALITGWRFVVLRLLSALPLPILAGLLAELVIEFVPIAIGTP